LRLSVPTPVADDFVGPALAEYLRRYPDMRLEVVADDRIVDLVAEGFDAALRVGQLTDSSLGAVRLAVVSPVLAAAPRYLDRAPPLRRPRDLTEHAHAVVAFGKRRRQSWTFVGRGGATEDVELVPRASSTSAPLVAQLAADGVGIALIPRSVAARAGLAILEPGGFRPQPYDLSIVTPSARMTATKVRAFIELMRDFVQARLDLFDAVIPTASRRTTR
jgi:DNA-binding transcriptional LysR family regulator